MKTTKFTCLALLILTLPAARGEPLRTDINPALLYYQAFLVGVDVPQADRDFLFTNDWRGQKLPKRFGEIVAGYDRQFKLVREAAQQKVPCDWGIDLSRGPETYLPHLARAKAVAQVAQLRTMWDLQQGNQIGARDDLLAAFVLARNVSRDGILISAVVQDANEAIIYATVAGNFGQFSPDTLKQLTVGFDAAPAQRTAAMSIPTEKASITDWLLRKIQELQKANPGDDIKVMAGLREILSDADGDTNFWPQVVATSAGTSKGVIKLLQETEPLYARLAAVMTLPQPEYEVRAAQFSAENHKSQNPFVAEFVLGWERARGREFRIQAELAMVHAAVEYKLHGEAGLKSVQDPFGNGPFAIERFVFEGVDRGFELNSAYNFGGVPCGMIFVEKEGPPFSVSSPNIGKAVQP
ncbi:MAG: hypothetical protein ACLQUR_06930 [Limisphaerales bacterium]